MASPDNQRPLKTYIWCVIVLGTAGFLFSVARLPITLIDLRFLSLAVITIGIGSRIMIRIPRLKAHFSFSDTFIFLAMLLYGGEAAILLATVEAYSSARRFCNRRLTVFFNAAVMACATFLVVWALRVAFGGAVAVTQGGDSAAFYIAVCVMALIQYVVNSGLASVYEAIKSGNPVWQTWKTHYMWTSLTYLMGAASAGALALLVHSTGFYVLIATAPVLAVIYFTYRTYLKNVEISLAQAEQAERHTVELQAQAVALAESEERFRSSFDNASIGMALVTPQGRWLKVNRSLCDLVGYTAEELLATRFQTLAHAEDLSGALAHLNGLLTGEAQTCQMEMRYSHREGHAVWTLWNVSAVREAGSGALHLIFQIQDITPRKQAEERLLHDALHDALTTLPNRALFTQRLNSAIERTRRERDYQFAVLFLDLDRFKYINDSLGHLVGDELLIEIARRLETCMRHGDTVARLGGDEFTVLLDNLRDPEEAPSVAERIRQELARPYELSGHEVFTSASIGIALSTVGYTCSEDLMRDADTAMYQAKRLGKARCAVFDSTMHDTAKETLSLETDLRRAIERDEFLVHYQPIMSLRTNHVAGFEALVRWLHPERGLIMPDKFIPLAEETGLINLIGRIVLGKACRQARVWQEQFPGHTLFVSVNLSGKQFAQTDLVECVSGVLRDTGLAPQSLKLEITESILMDNTKLVASVLKRFRDLGVDFSLDDFGTGYSSLSYLHHFPASTLKIDRSFINPMNESRENAAIVRTILTLARSLDMTVIAEGIETGEQAAQLKNLDCEYGQGYFFSRPVDCETATAFLSNSYSPDIPCSIGFDLTQDATCNVM